MVGDQWGWRTIYFLAAGTLLILLAVLCVVLPRCPPSARLSYPALLRSLGGLVRDQPVLRESCLFGSMTFAAFSAFWMTIAFHLESPALGYGSDVTGMLGLLALVGALAAGSVGRLTDRLSARGISGGFLVLTLGSFGSLYAGGGSLFWLGAGVVLMDLGVQAVHVANQSRVYSLIPAARNRLGTIYIVTYFGGGAIGSAAGVWGWTRFGWAGVCTIAAGLVALAMLPLFARQRDG